MITVYSKPNCMQCKYVKEYLSDKEIPFESIDVIEDKEALQRLIDAGHSTMPVVEIEGQEPHTGFRPDILAKLAVK